MFVLYGLLCTLLILMILVGAIALVNLFTFNKGEI
ncbi:hypothetical protein LP048_007 [Listeria phage LP-048]|uniref:Uncharacterized protein n=1 Tax=Listeria phage LP-048 TaxID=1173764 RepID=A0A059T8Y9_9CAUD|nr:hypothetical protein LP048_007 [Listeria phage LP-048]AHL19680.1 hypothetical protein LP048_007 [Listeria phage LP-048]